MATVDAVNALEARINAFEASILARATGIETAFTQVDTRFTTILSQVVSWARSTQHSTLSCGIYGAA